MTYEVFFNDHRAYTNHILSNDKTLYLCQQWPLKTIHEHITRKTEALVKKSGQFVEPVIHWEQLYSNKKEQNLDGSAHLNFNNS